MGKVTLSLGVADSDKKTSADQVLKSADDALYFSKKNGRNQSSVFDESLFSLKKAA